MHLAVAPRAAQLVGVTATGEKLDAGLLWKKPKPLASSAGNEVAQAHVVDQHQQADMRLRRGSGDAHRHVAGDHRDLGFEVDAPCLVGETRCRRTVR